MDRLDDRVRRRRQEKANRLNQAMVPISMLVTRLRTLQQPPLANIRHI
jgi:hypothetical protein